MDWRSTTCQDICKTTYGFYSAQPNRKHSSTMIKCLKNVNKNNKTVLISGIKEGQIKALFTQHQGEEIHTASPNIFHHGSSISMSHTMSFVYHLPPGYNQSNCSHPGCRSILKNSLMSLCGTWREGCGSNEDKECVFSADRCPVQHADRALNSDPMYGFRGCLHKSLRMFITVWQANNNHISRCTQNWPLHLVVFLGFSFIASLSVNVDKCYSYKSHLIITLSTLTCTPAIQLLTWLC